MRSNWWLHLEKPGEKTEEIHEDRIQETEIRTELHLTASEWRKYRDQGRPWAQWSDRELAGLVSIKRPQELGKKGGVHCFVIWQYRK